MVNGYEILLQTLKKWGVSRFVGVTGGGIIHFLSFLKKHDPNAKNEEVELFTLSEYLAGYSPLGYYLSSNSLSAAISTTGAASKLLLCGLSDAKVHNIPAIYIMPYFNKKSEFFCPIQDTSRAGNNLFIQVQSELPHGCFLLDSVAELSLKLSLAHNQLMNKKPVVLFIDHAGINSFSATPKVSNNIPSEEYIYSDVEIHNCILTATDRAKGKHITFLVGEEANYYPQTRELLNRISNNIAASVIWSINGANSVCRENLYGKGYVYFGGNDHAINHLLSLDDNDVLFVLGAAFDEYTTNMKNINANLTLLVTSINDAYGELNNTFSHHVSGEFILCRCRPDNFLKKFESIYTQFENIPSETAPADLNLRTLSSPAPGKVDICSFYKQLEELWPANSIGFDDICLAYKDRQYITQRPHPNIRFFSLYRGSAMGSGLGLGVGAALANNSSRVFVFSGDGCFRLYAGSLGEIAQLGIVLFIFNNESFGVVEQGINAILPDLDVTQRHVSLSSVDYCNIAKGFGWNAYKIESDLSNLSHVFNKAISSSISTLIEVSTDVSQVIGLNPRAYNL